MVTLLYPPHMTSVDNEAGLASGHADVPLSAIGRRQAAELGRHYATEAPVAIFCSDLQRALTTAQIAFAARGLRPVPDARLRECDYGDLTPRPAAEVDAEWPRRVTEPFPHGESLCMAVQRLGAFLRDLCREYHGTTVVVIGHRATKYGLAYWSSGASLEDIVRTAWEWRRIPIWRYELTARALERRSAAPG
ncbi:MAG TPA: histidine phosphatase family protein [bacterium]|nr:histidine phosphatase family protein [bacterium]